MLKTARALPPILALLLFAACGQKPELAPEPPVSVEASYRLLFNDALVGNAFFELQVDAEGHYRLEAFTTPAGQMQQASGHEVLESSQGTISHQTIRPQRFDHSVIQGERIEAVELQFDWEGRVLNLTADTEERSVALFPNTQDRLSYLLATRRLLMSDKSSSQIQIAAPEATEETRLEVIGAQEIEIPLGRYKATAVRRISPERGNDRTMWFDTEFSPLPLRISRSWENNTVEMQLESLSPRPSDPH